QSGPRQFVRFVDAAAILENRCADRLPGLDWFYDHVHLNFSGNFVVAESMAEQIREMLPDKIRGKAANRPILSQRECEKRLCFTGLDQLVIARQMSARLLRPPFTSQSDHQNQVEYFQQMQNRFGRFRSGPDLQNCLAQYEAAVKNSGDGDWLHLLYARWLWVYANDTRRSRQHLELLLRQYPQWTDGYNQMSKLAFLEGDPVLAESLCWKALRQNPYTADAFLGLGVIRQHQKRLAEAVDFMRKCILYNPYSPDNHLALSSVLMAQSEVAEAKKEIDRAIELDPTEAKAWLYRGLCLMAEKTDSPTRQKAIESVQKAVDLAPDFAEARSRLALLFLQEGKPAEARTHLEEVVKARPRDPQALYMLAKCFLQQAPKDPDHLSRAQSLLEQAVTIQDNFEQAQFDLAAVLANLGQTERAKERLRKVLQLNPANQQAKEALKKLP
ncbi:MAG: tetratricopeptide repeat protein, partial [Phycisphaerae bacterium]|nr:tetratricopeptide repeat protein [Phycisphaerae bacterium]